MLEKEETWETPISCLQKNQLIFSHFIPLLNFMIEIR